MIYQNCCQFYIAVEKLAADNIPYHAAISVDGKCSFACRKYNNMNFAGGGHIPMP
jgi:hypothetical protein